MAATANRRKQDDKNLEILRELISINGNKYCLDCNQRGPTYVNTTIGSFVCSKCSGMLRGLTPPHRVKSISMATFTPEEIGLIRARGNDYCRRVWLGLYDGESVNFTDEQSVKDFMSDKYEKKRYYLESAASENVMTNGNNNSSLKNKGKVKSGGSALISIQGSKNGVAAAESSRVARPVNNYPAPLLSNLSSPPTPTPANTPQTNHTIPPPVPDFPVDFNNADIYNGNLFNNNNNNLNSFATQNGTSAFSTFNQSSNNTNDRYAALAELDNAFKQQHIKQLEESNSAVNHNKETNKNPFQSVSAGEMFANKNPFCNGAAAWSQPPRLTINPFMPTAMNNGGYTNSKNPFL